MTTDLVISKHLSAPIEVASLAVAILGIRGSGKTNTASVIAEELLERGQPMVYIDPTDAAWGLRSGYSIFIFGGTHGDLPLREVDGKALAEFVVAEQASAILSLRHLRKGAQKRFVTEFCEELFHLKGRPEYRTPLTVFIDEAPLFCPQKVLGEDARVVGAIEDLVARGRNAGFGVVLISQRAATINKDVLTQCDAVITHRLTAPHDRKALAEWIDAKADEKDGGKVLSSLPGLENGRAWVWAPILGIMSQVQIRMRRTFDSSSTPKRGQQPAKPKRLEEIDLSRLQTKLADAAKEAEANDPKALKRKIAALERNAGKKEPVVDAETMDREYRRGKIDGYGEAVKSLMTITDHLASVSALKIALEELRTVGAKWMERSTASALHRADQDRRNREASERVQATPVAKERPYPVMSPRGGGQQRILVALAQCQRGLTRRQLGMRAGLSSSSGTFSTYLSDLRSKGYIERTGDMERITQAGIDNLGPYDPLPTGSALREYWEREIGGGAARILTVLAAHPTGMGRSDLGQEAGLSPNSGTFSTYLSKLRTLELIDGASVINLSEDLLD